MFNAASAFWDLESILTKDEEIRQIHKIVSESVIINAKNPDLTREGLRSRTTTILSIGGMFIVLGLALMISIGLTLTLLNVNSIIILAIISIFSYLWSTGMYIIVFRCWIATWDEIRFRFIKIDEREFIPNRHAIPKTRDMFPGLIFALLFYAGLSTFSFG